MTYKGNGMEFRTILDLEYGIPYPFRSRVWKIKDGKKFHIRDPRGYGIAYPKSKKGILFHSLYQKGYEVPYPISEMIWNYIPWIGDGME